MELYNEDMIDLLNPRSAIAGNRGPSIREDSHGNMVLIGVERKAAGSRDEIISFLHQGTLSRTTASTDMNRTSSRSHAIFTVILRQQGRRSGSQSAKNGGSPGSDYMTLDSGPLMISKMHFVDLAGSERIKRTGAAGTRVKEGISINAGLLALGNVISALGNSVQQGKRQPHVPYRDSKLTRLLQDSLGGNSQTLMLACISPSNKNHAESLNTIRYANRARNIRNKVAVNFDKNSSAELSILKTEVARLRGEIAKLKLLRRQSSLSPNDQIAGQTMVRLEAELSRLVALNTEVTEKLEQAVRRAAILEIERDSLCQKISELGGTVDIKLIDSATTLFDSSLLKQPGSAVLTGSAGNATPSGIRSPRPNSIFTDGAPGVLSDQMLNTMDRELSDQAERHEQQIDSVRHHYESKLELLQETLAIVQKERDVALQRLTNANKASGSSGPPNRRALGLENGASTPTKIRQPSRLAKA
ncbi:Kinesin-like protein kif21b, partial [Linderina macrospora]